METHMTHSLFDRRPISRSRGPSVKWFKEWVPQDLVTTGGKGLVLKWVNEATLKAMKNRSKEPDVAEPEPEPTTEVLFLCSYEGCGKTFIDAGALRKHSHIHGERQYVCHYENCGKKFLDSSKLKRHFLIHTGERDFVCPHEGCGKAFSLDFNLRSHMKTHAQENYHICPYADCGKRYAHEYKLKNHIASHHEKVNVMETPKYVIPPEKPVRTPKSTTGPASSDRPYGCPYEGCEKAYIHEYKLNLHLRREHPGHFPDENAKANQQNTENEMDEGSDQDAYAGKRGNGKHHKQSRPKPNMKLPPSKVSQRKNSTVSPVNLNLAKKHRMLKDEVYLGEDNESPVNLNLVKKHRVLKEEVYLEEDSEETEEERENIGDGWRYGENNDEDDDDEETEYED